MTLHDAQALLEPLFVFHIFFNWHGYYYMLGTALNTFPTSTHSVLIAPLWSVCDYRLHFTNRKTAQKSCRLSKITQLVGGRARIWTRQSLHYHLAFCGRGHLHPWWPIDQVPPYPGKDEQRQHVSAISKLSLDLYFPCFYDSSILCLIVPGSLLPISKRTIIKYNLIQVMALIILNNAIL